MSKEIDSIIMFYFSVIGETYINELIDFMEISGSEDYEIIASRFTDFKSGEEGFRKLFNEE